MFLQVPRIHCVTVILCHCWHSYDSHLVIMSGCTQQSLDQTQMLNMQEDAYCHRISAEVMKRCLYKPAAPCRQQTLSRSHRAHKPQREMLSLPVTPGQSTATTPVVSPTTSYSCFTVLSCNTTPRATSPETPDASNQGLASLLTPRPRYVSCYELSGNERDSTDSVFLTVPSISDQFCSRKRLSASIHCV